MPKRQISKLLVIGGSGFVGQHFLELANELHIPVAATKLPHEAVAAPCEQIIDLDILDDAAVRRTFKETCPQAVVHLAAQSSVGFSWKNMEATMNINVMGALHVLQAAASADTKPRLMMIGSAEEYGHVPSSGQISEDWQPEPANPYAVSKLTQTMLARLFHQAYSVDVVMMRAFNHIGAGQRPGFVVPDFCRQIVNIERGKQPPVISVGNLSAARDFTDVRDIVRGYMLALRYGKSGEIYNIGSGKSVTIGTLLNDLLALAKVPITVRQDPAKMRPVEVPLVRADITKLHMDTGYQPKIPLEESLLAALEYERKH